MRQALFLVFAIAACGSPQTVREARPVQARPRTQPATHGPAKKVSAATRPAQAEPGTPLSVGTAEEEDPFAVGPDALAVSESDGSSSLRAKIKLKKMLPDMVLLQVKDVDDSKFPECILVGRILKKARSKAKHFKLMARGKTYKFSPVLKMQGEKVNLQDKTTQKNLGGCYFPAMTKLVVRVTGVDLKAKVFIASEICGVAD